MTGTNSPRQSRVADKRTIPLISDEKLRDLYSRLIACRLFNQSFPCGVARESGTGCEAVTTAITACMRTGDSVLPTPHSFAAIHLLARSFAPPSAVISGATAQLAAVAGDALRHKLEQRGSIAVAFVDTGSTEPMHAIFTEAVRQSLPVLYVLSDDPRIGEVAGGIPAFCVDSTDTVAAYRVAYESIARAREGGGPTILLRAVWPGNGFPDAVVRLEQYLTVRKLFRADWRRQLERRHRAAAVRMARNAAAVLAEVDVAAMPIRAPGGGML